MDYLKEGIGLRAMAQRDPLVEYQREGYDMFIGMLEGLKEESVGFLFNVQVEASPQAPAVAPQAMPEGLRAKGIDDGGDRPLTYVGPSEDGNAEVQQHDAPTARGGKVSRKERRETARQDGKERKLLRRR
jgi:preprotein translocase subunit SecA